MTHLLLAIIYAAFISLGLPDALLGAAWPVMHLDLGVAVSWAGIVSMIISVGTIFSSLFSGKLIRRLGTGKLTAISVAMTAAALFGFSMAKSFWGLCLWAIPYGLGAGSVDAALNAFVALHYKSRHMSWLHCFWGLGATAGPYIMGLCLTGGPGWPGGYRVIGLIQVVLTGLLFLSLPMWREKRETAEVRQGAPDMASLLSIPGVKAVLLGFLFYCGLESTAGLWASSYLVFFHGLKPEEAASWAALFYLGITLGRFLSGFITDRLGDTRMIRGGLAVIGLGIVMLVLPLGTWSALAGLLLVGLGCAPIYPSVIHQSPDNFGRENAQSVIGMQMACAYVGASFLPPVFGFLSARIGLSFFPLCLLVFLGCMTAMLERMNAIRHRRGAER